MKLEDEMRIRDEVIKTAETPASKTKSQVWYFTSMKEHIKEIQKLLVLDTKLYNVIFPETCKEHAKIEAYDLISLLAELFNMPEILAAIPKDVHKLHVLKYRDGCDANE